MKNEISSKFFRLQNQWWKQRRNCKPCSLLWDKRLFTLRAIHTLCWDRFNGIGVRMLYCPQTEYPVNIIFLMFKDKCLREALWRRVPYSGRVRDANCFWSWLWSFENWSNDFSVRLVSLLLHITWIRYSCRE